METGENLNILIVCDYIPKHNWMSFFSWYSLNKNLPDAKVSIICNRKLMSYKLFDWTRKCNVPFQILKENTIENHLKYLFDKNWIKTPLLVISPEILAVRELNYEIKDIQELKDFVNSKENKINTFVNYSEGFGKYKITEENRHPFIQFNQYFQGELSLNEVKIEELFKNATPLFITLTRN